MGEHGEPANPAGWRCGTHLGHDDDIGPANRGGKATHVRKGPLEKREAVELIVQNNAVDVGTVW
jgi:hypothetical protein